MKVIWTHIVPCSVLCIFMGKGYCRFRNLSPLGTLFGFCVLRTYFKYYVHYVCTLAEPHGKEIVVMAIII